MFIIKEMLKFNVHTIYLEICSSTDLDSVGQGWGLRFSISDKLPGDTKTASLNVVL